MRELIAEQYMSEVSEDPTVESVGLCANCATETYVTPGRRAVHSRTGLARCGLKRPIEIANLKRRLYQMFRRGLMEPTND